jgi:hypothetical protein
LFVGPVGSRDGARIPLFHAAGACSDLRYNQYPADAGRKGYLPNPNHPAGSDYDNLARLETIQYSVEKIITAETGQEVFGPLFGDRLLFVAHGVVIAGVDLNQLEASDLKLRSGVLMVRLPHAEVFIATLDNEKSYVYDRQTGLFTKGEQDLETLARQAAEEEIQIPPPYKLKSTIKAMPIHNQSNPVRLPNAGL